MFGYWFRFCLFYWIILKEVLRFRFSLGRFVEEVGVSFRFLFSEIGFLVF